MYRHPRVIGVMAEAEEVVRDLFARFFVQPQRHAGGVGATGSRRRCAGARAPGRGFHRRDDRPLCAQPSTRGCFRKPVSFDLTGESCDSAARSKAEKSDMTDYSNIFATVLGRVHAATDALIAAGRAAARSTSRACVVEPPRDASHGDMATNAAMVLAKDAGKKPRELAELIAEKLRADDLIAKVDVAGPGFINLALKPAAWIDDAAQRDRGGRRLRPRRRRRRRAGQCRIRLGQSDRADACRPLPRRGVRRCAGEPARLRRLRGHARILHQRCRRAGRRARALGLSCATARRSARTSARSRKGSIPATT